MSKGGISIRWAQTDRKGDSDLTMGAVSLYGSSGQGFLRDSQGTMWSVAAKNPNFGEQLDLNAISITDQALQPFLKQQRRDLGSGSFDPLRLFRMTGSFLEPVTGQEVPTHGQISVHGIPGCR